VEIFGENHGFRNTGANNLLFLGKKNREERKNKKTKKVPEWPDSARKQATM
jgi:hypothetical protein